MNTDQNFDSIPPKNLNPEQWQKWVQENAHILSKRKKPPLGLMPKKIFDKERATDIFEAMKRFSKAEKTIPIEWITEIQNNYYSLFNTK